MRLRLVPAVHRATHRIGLYLASIGDERLSQGEAHLLAHLAAASPASIRDLHRGLAHKPSTLTSILDRLERRGFITREVGAADRRTFVVALTAKGTPVARRVHRRVADLERAVAATRPAADLRAFQKVIDAIEQQARDRTPRPGRR
jgi:DNA-binding MarR family transcriptional regulator